MITTHTTILCRCCCCWCYCTRIMWISATCSARAIAHKIVCSNCSFRAIAPILWAIAHSEHMQMHSTQWINCLHNTWWKHECYRYDCNKNNNNEKEKAHSVVASNVGGLGENEDVLIACLWADPYFHLFYFPPLLPIARCCPSRYG